MTQPSPSAPALARSASGLFSFLVPNDTLEARAFFQFRLAAFAALVAALTGGFYLVVIGFALAKGRAHVDGMLFHPSNVFHLLAVAAALGSWGLVRKRSLSAFALEFFDVACTVSVCSCFALMSLRHPPLMRADLVVLLATSFILVGRAAILPSTAARTALVGAACFAPGIVVTHLMFRDVSPELYEFPPAAHALTWSVVGVVTTGAISKVIYGLEQKVREAMKVGQYTLEEQIGEGGMGVVYRASHAMLRRPTAIKLLPREKAGVHGLARFEREVQLTSQLTHPNTVAVYDYGRTADGIFYYAMEYLDGITLEELVRADGPQPPARVAHILRQVCGALHEAHSSSLIHRDIKPSNIVLGVRGAVSDVVKVLDFGLVKAVSSGEDPMQSGTNVITGTPMYLAPEAITTPDEVDARSDLYALGATAYLLLTGKTVFDGKTVVELCGQHLHEKPKAPSARVPGIPRALEALVLSCLAKNPAKRPASAAALAEALAACDVGSWTEGVAAEWWQGRGEEVSRGVRERRSAAAATDRPRAAPTARR